MDKELEFLKTIIEEMETKINKYDLSDKYLKDNDKPTREEIGIGEYAYGITMIPCSWVIKFLKSFIIMWSIERLKLEQGHFPKSWIENKYNLFTKKYHEEKIKNKIESDLKHFI